MRLFNILFGMTTILLTSSAFAQERILTAEQTPQKIRSYLQAHFPENKILMVKEDKERSKIDYEVKLDGRIELKFDKNFVIKDIESKKALPDGVIPQPIRDYVGEKYPNTAIVSWEKEKRKQKVELDNGLDLEFDLNGRFIRLD